MVKRVLVYLAVVADVHAFTSNARLFYVKSNPLKKSAATLRDRPSHAQLRMSEAIDPSEIITLGEGNLITPEGYGYSSPIRRILDAPNCNSGYYRALSTESVADVMESLSISSEDRALVFDESSGMFLGLFAETDYLKFSADRAKESSEAEESEKTVANYVTPSLDVVCVTASETANVAVAAMLEARTRHLVIADKLDSNQKIDMDSEIIGVLSMKDVINVIQKDEKSILQGTVTKLPSITSSALEENQVSLESRTSIGAYMGYGVAAIALASVATFFSQSPWLHEHADLAMIGIFVLGYVGIIFEEVFELNKAAVALLMSTGLWVTYGDYYQSTGVASSSVLNDLGEQLAEVSDICFFLLAASAIVEVVDAHQGFKVVTNQIKTTSKKSLFWTIGFLTFFLSAILNNLTVTIVMCSLLRKLVPKEDDRKLFGAMVVVAANAGGVWTPIGDVTTTMLWINNQLSTLPTITELFLPSIACLVASLAWLVGQVEEGEAESTILEPISMPPNGALVFWSGIACLLAVPVFAELTGLPPYLAMLTGLGAIWTLTDVIHMGDHETEGEALSVPAALARLDTAGILFFLGILMSIGVLDKSGLLKELAVFLSNNLPNLDIIATVIGLASALIDNVPLVAATMGMYEISEYGTDSRLWQLIALCAGTGGSILVIGSASGVALMGLEKVDFLWYAKKVSIGAAVGYFAGIATYSLQNALLTGGLLGGTLPQAAAAADIVSGVAM